MCSGNYSMGQGELVRCYRTQTGSHALPLQPQLEQGAPVALLYRPEAGATVYRNLAKDLGVVVDSWLSTRAAQLLPATCCEYSGE